MHSAMLKCTKNIEYMRTALSVVFLFLFVSKIYSQKISGCFLNMPNQEISLHVYNGANSEIEIKVSTNSAGEFNIYYEGKSIEVGYLKVENTKSFPILLNIEEIEIVGSSLYEPQSIYLKKGAQNQLFQKITEENNKRLIAIDALKYLTFYYHSLEEKIQSPAILNNFNEELNRLSHEQTFSMYNLPSDGFLHWYFTIKNLINESIAESNNPSDNCFSILQKYRSIDYLDDRLYKSGLLKEVVESQFYLIEHCGLGIDSSFKQMQISIEDILNNLAKDEKKYKDVLEFLFKSFEEHSLNNALEYLSDFALASNSCSIDDDLKKKSESFQFLKKGDTVPNILFDVNFIIKKAEDTTNIRDLSQVNTKYTLVVFGASWCPKCAHEIPQLVAIYKQWHHLNFEIIFISLDENKTEFELFSQQFPFFSVCDFKKWETQAALDYKITSTPRLFLIDKNRKIILKPNSTEMLNEWLKNNLK